MSIAVKKSPCPGRRAVIVVLLALVIQFFGVEGSAAEPPGAVGCGHMTAFVSKTCPHCAAAKTFLADLQAAGAQFTIDYREVTGDPEARRAFAALVEREGIERPGVPTFDICGRIIVGLDEHAVREALYSAAANEPPRGAEVPVFGYISPANIGLPAFTIAIGLVDGFNPCAMWVLLFLLSILVNVKRRSRILIVAGTFVLVSGIIYFAFMAAWLNVFLILGFSRILQVFLGALAIVIGAIHLSDFFAAHKGVSLSISDSVKPRFYQRVRRVVHAENLPVALGATITLAILVNFIELLCTAGLPALYTQILSYYPLGRPAHYAYLVLYNLAYIADDTVMVAIAVVTLGHRRLQAHEGRWLKLLSGLFIAILGVILIATPEVFVY